MTDIKQLFLSFLIMIKLKEIADMFNAKTGDLILICADKNQIVLMLWER